MTKEEILINNENNYLLNNNNNNNNNNTLSILTVMDNNINNNNNNNKVIKTTGPIHNQRYKMKLCQHYEDHGFCPYEIKCQFAHGQAELEKWTNKRKKSMMNNNNINIVGSVRRNSTSSNNNNNNNNSNENFGIWNNNVRESSNSTDYEEDIYLKHSLNMNSSFNNNNNNNSNDEMNNSDFIRKLSIKSIDSIPPQQQQQQQQNSSFTKNSFGTPSSLSCSTATWDIESKDDCFSPLLSPSGIQNSPWFEEVDENLRQNNNRILSDNYFLGPPGTPIKQQSNIISNTNRLTPGSGIISSYSLNDTTQTPTTSQLFQMRTLLPASFLNKSL